MSHFRHCPKHRKPLPCVHCAMLAEPKVTVNPTLKEPVVEPITEPLPVVEEPLPTPTRMGRPRKHADDNARKRAHKQKLNEPERRRMMARILVKIKKYASKPRTYLDSVRLGMEPLSEENFKKYTVNIREWLGTMRDALNACSYMEVKRYYDILVSRKGIADAKGRLPGERSGETPQANGTSELETIIAAIHREEGELPAKPTSPSGTGADSYTEVTDAGDDKGTAYGGGRAISENVFDDLLVRACRVIAEKEFDGPRVYEGAMCKTVGELDEHILSRYHAGEKERRLSWLMHGLAVGEGAPKITHVVNRYYVDILLKISELEWEDKEAGKRARRMTRLAGEARRKAFEERLSSPPGKHG